jgi:hypothetical protein
VVLFKIFESESHYVVQTGLKLMILFLSLPNAKIMRLQPCNLASLGLRISILEFRRDNRAQGMAPVEGGGRKMAVQGCSWQTKQEQKG